MKGIRRGFLSFWHGSSRWAVKAKKYLDVPTLARRVPESSTSFWNNLSFDLFTTKTNAEFITFSISWTLIALLKLETMRESMWYFACFPQFLFLNFWCIWSPEGYAFGYRVHIRPLITNSTFYGNKT